MGQLSMELYLNNLRSSYKKADKKKKGGILEQFCEVTGFHRKHAIRLLNTSPKRPRPKRRGRHPVYKQKEYLPALKQIWLVTDQMCGKRLKQALPLWLPHYSAIYEELNPEIYNGLLSMSASTIDRMLSSVRSKTRKSLCATKPGSILKSHIPVKTEQWDEAKPGFMEADTVAHCGDSMQGSFAWTLALTDIFSEWTELRAVWNKGSEGVVEQIKDVESILPFELLGFDSDNGSEFLNWHLVCYFSNYSGEHRIQLTRSRPYNKNDNAHVEQKNWTHVRHLLGYHRIDNKEIIPLLNNLYRNEVSKLNNFFLPHVPQ